MINIRKPLRWYVANSKTGMAPRDLTKTHIDNIIRKIETSNNKVWHGASKEDWLATLNEEKSRRQAERLKRDHAERIAGQILFRFPVIKKTVYNMLNEERNERNIKGKLLVHPTV
jgi:hypothetical protein